MIIVILRLCSDINRTDFTRGVRASPEPAFPHLLTQFHSRTPGHPEGQLRPSRRGALPVHPSSRHGPALPGLSAAVPVPPLPGPAGPGPGVQYRPPRAPSCGSRARLPARLALEQRAGYSLRAPASGRDPPLRVFAALLRRGHQESSWGRGPCHGPSVLRRVTWTG